MQRAVVAALLLCVLMASVSAHQGKFPYEAKQASRLGSALSAAIREIIQDGTYESILDANLGPGNWEEPAYCSRGAGGYDDPYSPGDEDSSLADVLDRGVLVVGSRNNGIFGQASADGKFITSGIEPTLANALARRIGAAYGVSVLATVVNVPGSLDNIAAGLDAGDFDVAMAGLSLTVDRALQYEYTCEYFADQLTFMRASREPERLITGLSDADHEDVWVGVLAESTGAGYAARHFQNANIVAYENNERLREAAVFGSVHVILADEWEIDSVLNDGYCNRCFKVPHVLEQASYRVFLPYTEYSSASSLSVSIMFALFVALFAAFLH